MAVDLVAQQQLLDLGIRIQQIAAPTGAEGERAAWVAAWLRRCASARRVMLTTSSISKGFGRYSNAPPW